MSQVWSDMAVAAARIPAKLTMSQRVFIISDTHFGHRKVIEFENVHRPFATIEAHDRELVARWNATVRKKDTVWHLGDVCMGNGHTILSELRGIKRLVMGNHDEQSIEVYQQYFSSIHGAAEYKHCILTHIPVHECQFPRYVKNIHGHLHSKCIDDPRYFCASVERIGLAPVLFDVALQAQA